MVSMVVAAVVFAVGGSVFLHEMNGLALGLGSIHAELRSLNLLLAVAVQLHQLEAVGGNLRLRGGAYFKPFAVIQCGIVFNNRNAFRGDSHLVVDDHLHTVLRQALDIVGGENNLKAGIRLCRRNSGGSKSVGIKHSTANLDRHGGKLSVAEGQALFNCIGHFILNPGGIGRKLNIKREGLAHHGAGVYRRLLNGGLRVLVLDGHVGRGGVQAANGTIGGVQQVVAQGQIRKGQGIGRELSLLLLPVSAVGCVGHLRGHLRHIVPLGPGQGRFRELLDIRAVLPGHIALFVDVHIVPARSGLRGGVSEKACPTAVDLIKIGVGVAVIRRQIQNPVQLGGGVLHRVGYGDGARLICGVLQYAGIAIGSSGGKRRNRQSHHHHHGKHNARQLLELLHVRSPFNPS